MKHVAVALALALAAPSALAQDHARHHMMGMDGTALTVSAQAQVAEKPDLATITAGVSTDAPTAQAALAENAKRMAAVMAALKRAGVAERDIQTSQLSINPQMVYAENQPPRVTGYQAVNMVSVRLRDMGAVGKTIDTLIAQGGNQVQGVSFGLSDPDAALDRARMEALKRARARATAYAAAAGMQVARIVSITEGGSVEAPPVVMVAQARMMEATPVSGGEVSMTGSVTVVFELK